MGGKLDEYFTSLEVVCQTSSSYLALARQERVEELLNRIERRMAVRLNLGRLLVKYEDKEASITYVSPNKLIIRMKMPSTLDDVKVFLENLVGGD